MRIVWKSNMQDIGENVFKIRRWRMFRRIFRNFTFSKRPSSLLVPVIKGTLLNLPEIILMIMIIIEMIIMVINVVLINNNNNNNFLFSRGP